MYRFLKQKEKMKKWKYAKIKTISWKRRKNNWEEKYRYIGDENETGNREGKMGKEYFMQKYLKNVMIKMMILIMIIRMGEK